MTALERTELRSPARLDVVTRRSAGFVREVTPAHLNGCRRIGEIVVFVADVDFKPARITRPHHMCCVRCYEVGVQSASGTGAVQMLDAVLQLTNGRTLLRQVHLTQQRVVAGVVSQAAEIRVNLEPREAHISLHVGALEPIERLLLLTAPGVYSGDA